MMLLNKKAVRRNEALKLAQKTDRKLNRDRRLDRGSVLKKNINKVVTLTNEDVLGQINDGAAQIPSVDASTLIERVEASKLTGMSGNGFPAANKLKTFTAAQSAQRVILINGAECEPGLLHDTWLIRHRAQALQQSASALKKALSADRVLLAVRGRMKDIPGLSTSELEVVGVPLKYPMGEEHILIRQVLGIDFAKDVVPAAMGILVINVQTVWQIGRILCGSYDGGRLVTLADLNNGQARVAYVNRDTNIAQALAQVFGRADPAYAGSGIVHADTINANDTFSQALSFAAVTDTPPADNAGPCKGCGGCTRKCPMGVSVKDIVLAKEKDPQADVTAFHADRCICCGTCTYFCWAGKDPMSLVHPKDAAWQ